MCGLYDSVKGCFPFGLVPLQGALCMVDNVGTMTFFTVLCNTMITGIRGTGVIMGSAHHGPGFAGVKANHVVNASTCLGRTGWNTDV